MELPVGGLSSINNLTYDNYHVCKNKVLLFVSGACFTNTLPMILPPIEPAAIFEPSVKVRREVGRSYWCVYLFQISLKSSRQQHCELEVGIYLRLIWASCVTKISCCFSVILHHEEAIWINYPPIYQPPSSIFLSPQVDELRIGLVNLDIIPYIFYFLTSTLTALGNDEYLFTLDFFKSRLIQLQKRLKIIIHKFVNHLWRVRVSLYFPLVRMEICTRHSVL